MGINIIPLTAQIAERAAMLRAQHNALRLPDALVLATAQEHHGQLLTYDDRLARTAGPQPERSSPDAELAPSVAVNVLYICKT